MQQMWYKFPAVLSTKLRMEKFWFDSFWVLKSKICTNFTPASCKIKKIYRYRLFHRSMVFRLSIDDHFKMYWPIIGKFKKLFTMTFLSSIGTIVPTLAKSDGHVLRPSFYIYQCRHKSIDTYLFFLYFSIRI